MLYTSFIRGQVAFIFVLLLGSANLVSTNGDSDSPNKQVVDYNLQISELGEQFNQTIEVDTEKQTVLFKVPPHNNVDHSNILHDFKMNLSMLLLPEEKICYLLPLEKELLAPRKLVNDLDNAEKPSSKLKVIDNKWTVKSEVTDRSVLSDEMANLCSQYPIYYAEKMADSPTTKRIQTGGREPRNRRQIMMNPILMRKIAIAVEGYREIDEKKVCVDGKGKPSEVDEVDCVYNRNKRWKVECKIRTRTCYYIKVCDTLDDCYEKHIYNNIYCCEYVCSG